MHRIQISLFHQEHQDVMASLEEWGGVEGLLVPSKTKIKSWHAVHKCHSRTELKRGNCPETKLRLRFAPNKK
jgi:hypothetical protein